MSGTGNVLIDAAQRLHRFARERPLLIDTAVAVLGVILSLADLFSADNEGSRDTEPLAVVLILAAGFALVWRRAKPIAVLVVVLSLMGVVYFREYDAYLSGVGLPAIYTVAAMGESRRRAWTFVIGGGVALVAVASVSILDGPSGFRYPDMTGMIGLLLAASLAGAVVRNRHDIFLDTEARASRAEADQLLAAERAVANERLRIAREMHDVVAHGMSVISVQAAAAKESFETRPDRTVELLDSIEATGRESLAEMRRMLGVLRNGQPGDGDPHGNELAPQPSLDELDRLVQSCVEAGTPTELLITGDPARVSPGIELAAYRIVQEALTNVLKHGGASASARVELVYEPTTIRVSVLDTGRGAIAPPPIDGSGNGLIGMRERVEAYGGQLTAGPRAGGGYAIRASLPLDSGRERRRVVSGEPEGEAVR